MSPHGNKCLSKYKKPGDEGDDQGRVMNKEEDNWGKTTTSQNGLEPGDHSIYGRKSENTNTVQVSHKLNRRTNFALKWV